ncbi:MAG: 2-heptaprenyl-1,4-naphthoquinone methyltransferase [Anaerolineae bacterium]|jgi:demethylmenaquinone methyltransferase/2-methoxy-6-polyprenyl-1,4-benzoquinol methylase|nr:MAG: 2-heptaprenyl-1,4-naphthoquinone methyltransferase [Anaerolineae bacterium]
MQMDKVEQQKHPQKVRAMFTRIAPNYDRMNRIMTLAQDVRWRREVVQRAALSQGGWLLDLGTGTGDLAMEALQQTPTANVVAADFTVPMMQIGRQGKPATIHWCAADALHLPFADEIFDAVISGFLLRNLTNVEWSLREQYRVLKKGGRVVCLDTTQPQANLFSPLTNVHLKWVIPTLGKWFAGDEDAYTYLPQTTQAFLRAEALAELLEQAGFREVGFRRRMFGTIAIHWGVKR